MTNAELIKKMRLLLEEMERDRETIRVLAAQFAELKQHQVEIANLLKEISATIATKEDVQSISKSIEKIVKPFLELTRIYREKQLLLEKEVKDIFIEIARTKN